MTSSIIGQEHGIDIANSVVTDATLLQDAYDTVYNNKGKGWQEWMNMPHADKSSIDDILKYASTIRETAQDLVVFGIGGSALGVQSVATALMHLRYNSLPYSVRQAPRLHIEDNIDPNRFASLLDIIDLDKTHFIVTTKSGNTSETLAQFLSIYDLLIGKVGHAKAVNAITVITTFGKGDLYEVAKAHGFGMFDVPKGVGGRFSVLSNVGLVALAAVGIDIVGLLQGARYMQDKCNICDVFANPALMTAYLQVLNIRNGKNIGVLMPYADNLKYIADFYAQLWAESLGKAIDKNGKIVNVGQTPVKSLGVTDQHSMVQLFNEGPYDKVITFVTVQEFDNTVYIPKVSGVDIGEFLSGHTLNELLDAERIATEYAITKTCKPNYNIILGKLDAYTIGELLAYLMMQTAYAGAMLNIDTYNQPGVEQGKVATFGMLDRKGYQEIKKAILSVHKDHKLVI